MKQKVKSKLHKVNSTYNEEQMITVNQTELTMPCLENSKSKVQGIGRMHIC